MTLLQDFKKFLLRGNLIELAVAFDFLNNLITFVTTPPWCSSSWSSPTPR